MFLSNWLVFKIVLAAVTGLVDYPLAADVLLVYDNANKLYLSGGSLEYVSNVVLYKGETGYEISESSQLVTNYYITQTGTYRADLQICGIDYKTNEVEVTGTPSDIGVSTELTFDGYNQLSLTNTPTYRSSKLAYGSNVYDVGTLTDNLFIEKTGEYASLTFDTSSNVAYFSNVTVGTIIIAPPSPSLTFDTYNKLSIQNITPTSTTLRLDPNTYDIGTATDIYIEDTGTYDAAITASDKFALVSNVVTGTISPHPTDAVPSLTFDTYNKLSIENITPTATTLRLDSNTYDIGTASNVYIEDTGTYKVATKDANTFALVSNVVTGTISPHPTDAVPSLTFDTYNKLSIQNITPTSTTLRLGSNTYDIGTASNVYIEDTGTYEIETKDANTFALVSNVVGTITNFNSYTNTKGIYVGTNISTSYYATSTSTFSQDILIGDKNYSVSYWINIKANALSQNESAHIWWGNTSANNVMRIGFKENNGIKVISLQNNSIFGTIEITPDVWHHIVIARQSSPASWISYVDGVRDDMGNGTQGYVSVNREMYIGYTTVDGGVGYIKEAYMDDISVWNKTLSQSDVDSIYATGPSDLNSHVSATNLMAWWKFEDNGDDSATNSSNNLTVNSSSWYSSSAIAKKPTISLDFDGYNKLSIENITPTSTTLTDPNGSSFDIGTTTDIYIQDTGTYEAGIKDANTFALVSNVVGTVTQVAVYDYTQAGTTEQKIQASDKQANDNFGYSVSISGDYAIVGALGEDTGATDAGAAYIYTRDASTGVWGSEQKIQASDKQQSDEFGTSVSISGDYAIVGASLEDTGGDEDAGAAYIYTRDPSTGVWGSEQKIQASDKQQNDQFGYSVSISGDYAIVGARNEDTGRSNSGAAYIYKRDASTGVWGSEQKIQASDRQQADRFGWSVSISGDYAIVGARNEDTGGGDAGAAYIYKRDASTGVWGSEQKIQASDKQPDDRFGTSVSISGDYAIVGASLEDTGATNAGAAYIYTRDASTGVWGSEQKIQASDIQTQDEFGYSVSLSGDYAIVGARYEDTGATDAGAAYIYKRDASTGVWGSEQKIQASDIQTQDEFGYSVSISGDYAIVGARLEDTGGSAAGAAYIYEAPNIVPTLAYDGLNTLVISNVSTGSYNTFLEGSNVLACATDLTTYPVPRSGITGTFTYSARTKSDSLYAFTNDVSITDYYKTYQYPPIDGTTTGLTSSSTSATWTISGVQYSTESSVAGTPYNTFDNSITSGFDSASSTGDITITFESAKTIRKYIVWPYDSTAPVSTPGGSTDPTLSTDGTFRPKSWTVYGTNNTNDWSTVLDTVTNQPPSIYGDVHSISSPASYQYYKLSVTANNGGSGLKIGEWQLWGDA